MEELYGDLERRNRFLQGCDWTLYRKEEGFYTKHSAPRQHIPSERLRTSGYRVRWKPRPAMLDLPTSREVLQFKPDNMPAVFVTQIAGSAARNLKFCNIVGHLVTGRFSLVGPEGVLLQMCEPTL